MRGRTHAAARRQPERGLVVVSYDVSCDRRRTRLFKALSRYGEPVQYSVFECLITREELERLRAEAAAIATGDRDDVRFYPVCAACRRRTLLLGRAFTTKVPLAYVI